MLWILWWPGDAKTLKGMADPLKHDNNTYIIGNVT